MSRDDVNRKKNTRLAVYQSRFDLLGWNRLYVLNYTKPSSFVVQTSTINENFNNFQFQNAISILIKNIIYMFRGIQGNPPRSCYGDICYITR